MVVGHLAPDTFADNVAQTLQSMGHEVRAVGSVRRTTSRRRLNNFINVLSERLPRQDAYLQRHLIDAEREFQPDILLTMDRTIQPTVLSELRAGGAATGLWFPDAVSNMGRHDMFLAGYDRLFFKNPLLVDQLRDVYGLPAVYMPEACNSQWHRSNVPFGSDQSIVLVGNVHPTRAILIDRMIRAGLPVKIFGTPPPPWIDFPAVSAAHTGEYVSRKEKADVFRTARVVLNNLHPAEFGGLNCRAFEAAGSGGLLMTESRPGLEDLFEVGQEVISFGSFEELVEKCEALLRDPLDGAAIGDAAARRAHRDHTYENRLAEMLSML